MNIKIHNDRNKFRNYDVASEASSCDTHQRDIIIQGTSNAINSFIPSANRLTFGNQTFHCFFISCQTKSAAILKLKYFPYFIRLCMAKFCSAFLDMNCIHATVNDSSATMYG